MIDCLKKANSDKAVQAIVLAGKSGRFLAGADIREFGQPRRGNDIITVGNSLSCL